MLFDLQSPGRRGAVKVIFSCLAILMGGGLVLFGVGGDVQGGLFDAFKDDNQSTSDVFKKNLESAEKRVDANPQQAAAWANLAKVRYQAARSGSGFDEGTGAFTEDGKKDLAKVETAWERYLKLKPAKTDDSTALLMVQAFGPSGLGDYGKAVSAMELVLDAREPAVGLYVQYAGLSYLAGQTRKGDLAAKKAEELAPTADQKEQVKQTIAQTKQAAAQQLGAGAQSVPVTTPSG
jgi:hypothetical protein